MKTQFLNVINCVICVLFTISCENAFEYSPYSSEVPQEYRHTTLKNISELKQLNIDNRSSVRVAVFSDIHNYYNRLDKVVNSINHNYDIDFSIVPGDLTDLGSLKEFEFAHSALENLVMPYFTVIGNHDYRSNGDEIYTEMFGEKNYSVYYKGLEFIFFDNIIWESDELPDYEWLKQRISDTNAGKKVIVTHIPPQNYYPESGDYKMTEILTTPNTLLSISGHTHVYSYDLINDIPYLVCNSINRDNYLILTFKGDDITIEKIYF